MTFIYDFYIIHRCLGGENKMSSKRMIKSFNVDDIEMAQFININVERIMRFKKACEIAKKLLKNNCHDFFISLNTTEEDVEYNHYLELSRAKNIKITSSYDELDCSIEDVASVLKAMCILELTWLDEHRYIFNGEEEKYYEEEDSTINFYSSLISSLNNEQINSASDTFEEYILSLC